LLVKNPVNEEAPTHLDLFSGIGGFALAARWAGFRTIGFCEIDKFCQKIITKRFLAYSKIKCNSGASDDGNSGQHNKSSRELGGNSLSTRIYGDITELNGKDFTGVSLLTGGFPCQPFSCAGKRRGKDDDRYLWPEMLRVISEAKPAWVLGENVAGIINMELDQVLFGLETIGYATRPFVIPACGVDAQHRRNRVWIIANSSSDGLNGGGNKSGRSDSLHINRNAKANESQREGGISRLGKISEIDERQVNHSRKSQHIESSSGEINGVANWITEPNVGRVANGIPNRVDRLKSLGNAIVPQVAYQILKAIRQQL
jgi:DNA (cytosine-5)-methyltransferase 1